MCIRDSWSRLRAGPTLAGIAVGTLLAGGAALAGSKRIEGVHVGVIGLIANTAVAVIGSWLQARRSGAAGTGTPSASAR